MALSSKQVKRLIATLKITREQFDIFTVAQKEALHKYHSSDAHVGVPFNFSSDEFIALGTEPEKTFVDPDSGIAFKALTPEDEATYRAQARRDYKPHDDILNVWHPVYRDECAKINAETKPAPEPTINDLGANTIGKRKSSTGGTTGAKPLVRKLLGTKSDPVIVDGVTQPAAYPMMTVAEICEATKKSDVNIRTILSDLRSPKYCGAGGVFNTVAVKTATGTYYQYQEAAAS